MNVREARTPRNGNVSSEGFWKLSSENNLFGALIVSLSGAGKVGETNPIFRNRCTRLIYRWQLYQVYVDNSLFSLLSRTDKQNEKPRDRKPTTGRDDWPGVRDLLRLEPEMRTVQLIGGRLTRIDGAAERTRDACFGKLHWFRWIIRRTYQRPVVER